MRFFFKLLFGTLLLNIETASCQDYLSIEDAVGSALRSNYDIETVKLDSSSYAIDNQYSIGAFLPQINGNASRLFNNNNQNQKLSDGSVRERAGIKSNNLAASVNLTWTIFDGFRMFATRAKLAEFQRLGEIAVKQQIVITVAAVINNYYNIVRQKQQLKAIEEQISINDERVKLADKKFTVGLGAKPELLQAKVDLNAQMAAHLTQETLILQLKEQLNQLMGMQTNRLYEVADSIPFDSNIQFGPIKNELELSNPTLLLAKKNIDISRWELKETKGLQYPVVALSSAFNFTRVNNAEVINTFTPLFNQNRGLNYGMTLTVPILNGFNTRRLISQSKLNIRLQEVFYTNQLSQVDVALNNAFKNYELYKKLLKLEQENILLAKENVNIALERFRQGVSTNLELREAQISLEQGYTRLIDARYNTKVAETELLRLQGKVLR